MRKSNGNNLGMMFAVGLCTVGIGLGMVAGCSDSVSSDATMIGVAFQAGPFGGNGLMVGDSADAVTQINITRARVVLGKIEIRGADDTVVFRSEEHAPLIVELDLTGRVRTLNLMPVSPGEYSSALVRIDKLEESDSAAWNANPDVRNSSLVVEGYLNGDQEQTFVFSTGLDEEQGREFEPMTVQERGSDVVVFHFDYTQWFREGDGGLINPDNGQLAAWRSVVEENIVSSFSVD